MESGALANEGAVAYPNAGALAPGVCVGFVKLVARRCTEYEMLGDRGGGLAAGGGVWDECTVRQSVCLRYVALAAHRIASKRIVPRPLHVLAALSFH